MLLKCSPPLKEGEVIATMPEMVVREEELISGIAFDSATLIADSASIVSCSSIKRSQKIIA